MYALKQCTDVITRYHEYNNFFTWDVCYGYLWTASHFENKDNTVNRVDSFDLFTISNFTMLSSHAEFPPEVDISTLQLTSRVVWPAETVAIPRNFIMLAGSPPIPCPPGEPWKPNDGGYSLKSVLKWKSARYQSVRASHLEAVLFMFYHSMFVQKFVRLQANLHLETHFPLTHQDQTAVVNVYKKVYRHFW